MNGLNQFFVPILLESQTLIEVISASRAAVRTIRTNLRIAAAYNFIGIGFAALGLLHPVVAALLMTGSSLTVTWRALLLVDAATPIAASSLDTEREAHA